MGHNIWSQNMQIKALFTHLKIVLFVKNYLSYCNQSCTQNPKSHSELRSVSTVDPESKGSESETSVVAHDIALLKAFKDAFKNVFSEAV